MVQINWGMANMPQAGFQNALAQGMQMGAQARQAREEKEYKNALAGFDPSNPETLKPIMASRPEVGIQLQGQVQQQQAQQAQRQQADMGQFRQLLQRAGSSPEGWQQAMGAAQQMGLDLSTVPQQFDPGWAQQQLFIMDALSDPPTRDQLDRDMVRLGFTDPNQPGYRETATELILMSRARESQDEYGRPTLEMPRVTLPEQPQQPPPQAAQAQQGATFTMQQYQSALQTLPPERAVQFLQENGHAVQVNSPDEARRLPSGTPILLPDGTVGRVP